MLGRIPAAVSPFQVEFLFSGALCAILIAAFLISILIAIWVYRDAESRGMSGVLWVIVVLIAGLIGLIVFLVVRKDKMVPMAAPAWGVPPAPGMPPTGAPPTGVPPAAQASCRNCGAPFRPGASFCEKCGARVM